ncbi:hypothetical protein [Stenotrophomonas maltophilia]|uniref:hypothetical protein n=1 Tax=Stenotrophomonas maltophilia TaxID=40324 RepID=UPI0016588BBE|nr:hypothetical protein [Stenotrophomonas maltophilia]MBC9114599.1 hypothetical protein [Stenotrophomonas maltophilia]
MTSEFIDAYSDDQIYLHMLEGLVNTHPVEANVPDSIKYSSFSRLWAVMMVGGVECMIKEWTESRPRLSDIYAYFQDGPNDKRLERLENAFKIRGLPVDSESFQDYLAIKYIRNAYIHGRWNESQRTFVVARGFPNDIMHFDAPHLERMKSCYLHVMNNLGMASALESMREP